jgi:hypothetical protein
MIAFLPLLILSAAGLPQMPIGSGPFASVSEVVEAAHNCGVTHLPIEIEQSAKRTAPDVQQYLTRAEVRLFLDDAVAPGAQQCMTSWQTKKAGVSA